MKVSKERRQLCSDVANSAEIKLQKDLERRKQIAIERSMDKMFGYVLLTGMIIAFVICMIDIWRGL